MQVGQKVKLVGIPPDCKDDDRLQTRTVFERCLGRVFMVVGLEQVDGLAEPLVRLNVGHIFGRSAELETIWVEPRYLEVQPL